MGGTRSVVTGPVQLFGRKVVSLSRWAWGGGRDDAGAGAVTMAGAGQEGPGGPFGH